MPNVPHAARGKVTGIQRKKKKKEVIPGKGNGPASAYRILIQGSLKLET
jgi:hypothetical protein